MKVGGEEVLLSDVIGGLVARKYAFEFHSDFETEPAPQLLSEEVIRLISAK